MSVSGLTHGTRGLACTRCGGALLPGSDPEQLRCRYCDTDHLLRADDDVSAVAPAGRISGRRAHRALMEALREGGSPSASVRERDLVWLPFWQVEAKLVGWQVYQELREAGRALRGPDGEEIAPATPRERRRVEELVARDLDLTLPACDTRSWGLLGIADRIDHLRLRPFSLERESRRATVCSVVVPRDAARRRALQLRSGGLVPRGATGVKQRVSLVRVRMRIVYYPVWKLRFTALGEPGEADVDGITGRLLRGDVPRALRSRAPFWLAVASGAGWLGGFHPALGMLGLAATTWRRGTDAGLGADGGRWLRWMGRELRSRPIAPSRIGG